MKFLPTRRGDSVFHAYSVYARGLEDGWWFLLLPQRDSARKAGGMGGAQGSRGRRPGAVPDFSS